MGEIISIDHLLRAATALQTDTAPWAGTLREQGREKFAALGIPNRWQESWKYSDLSQALAGVPAGTAVSRTLPCLDGAYVAFFENGVLDISRSALPDDYLVPLTDVLADSGSPFAGTIGRINGTEQKNHPILGLNTARMEQGFVLRVPKGETLSPPLHVRVNWTMDGAESLDGRHIRLLVELEEGAEATILETHGGTPGFATVVTELRLAQSAKLTHIRIDQLGGDARQSAVTLGELAGTAQYKGFYLSEGAYFCRHEALFELNGEDANVEIDGAFLVTGNSHCDNTTIITHAAPHTTSRQAFRGVLSGASKSAYQGCVKVRPDAQKTSAYQMSRALLLSKDARIATKPELEIFADDVKCSHGATAGELDGEALFFLRARGIPEEEARAMLVEAFLQEALDTIERPDLREVASGAVRDWLAVHATEVIHAG
ncbi:Fe-S cluster assembly protein SufD [Roseibium litorale]|uniref:Fe-S cluster assembly protein SufD n=1 Tax=Roseibium litorale TaxID=2803841 RepID=A0ABR9CR53_9HYPH|nr:Fe-S cluster assembly protein SufD [Roseibium litorale]MBD8893314.1 Fe-S cluster assembly protein SufD [Roseibium litorale]